MKQNGTKIELIVAHMYDRLAKQSRIQSRDAKSNIYYELPFEK